MNNLMTSLDNAFNNYPNNLNEFLNENNDLVKVLDTALHRGFAKREEMETIQELYDIFDNHIKFHSEYNEDIGVYL